MTPRPANDRIAECFHGLHHNQRVSDEPLETGTDGPSPAARLCTKSDLAAQYARHHERLHQFAGSFFRGRRPEAAEDAVMLVFTHLMDLAEKGELTDKGATWEPYLRRAIRNRCIDIIREEKRTREHFPPGDESKQRVVTLDPLGDAVSERDEAACRLNRLRVALAGLSDRHAVIIKLKFWDLLTDKQIGETLGISGQAVGQQLRTALKRLNEEVTKA